MTETPTTGARPLVAFERDLTATAALTTYSLAVALGFARVFSGWEFLVELALLVVAGHGTSLAMRRARVPGWVGIPVLTLGLGWIVCLLRYRATTTLLLPWRATWDQFSLDVDLVQAQFQTAVAPVIYDVGWATLAGIATIIAVVMADSFAFRAEARGEALVPGGVLFVFVAAVGSPRLRVVVTGVLIAAAVVAVVALRTLHDRRRRVELRPGGSRASRLLPATFATAAAVAVLAGIVGPRIPGAQAEPLYETRGRGGGVTNIANPLVDIRSRLVNQGNVELFRVNANVEAYWRVAALPEFDGRTFRLPRRELSEIEGSATTTSEQLIQQQLQILSLRGNQLPAAADPIAAEPNTIVRYDRTDNTLIKTSDLAPGDLFTIYSEAPDVTPDVLRSAGTSSPPDEIYLELPDLPGVVAELAAEVTAGATTDYDRLIALQDWFRTFKYSLEVQSGHSSNAIESFLQIRAGYCEQFSATFAAMARTLGIPSRVAVGYTSGRLMDNWYSVLGKNAHAWPEIWFNGVGWVPFEPTPGRGIPGAQVYTGVNPEQDESGPDSDAVRDSQAEPLPPTPTTVFKPPTSSPGRPQIEDPEARRPPGGREPATLEEPDGFPYAKVVVGALIAAALLTPPLARRVRSRTTRHRTPAQRVSRAWHRACNAARRAGVPGQPSMTTREWAAATADVIPVAARPMASLADVVDRFEYARPEAVAAAATTGSVHPEIDCELWATQVGRIAADRLGAGQRTRAYFTDWG